MIRWVNAYIFEKKKRNAHSAFYACYCEDFGCLSVKLIGKETIIAVTKVYTRNT